VARFCCAPQPLPAHGLRRCCRSWHVLSLGILTSNMWAITQTLAGPQAAGNWSGIQNAVGNLGGVVAPYLTGVIMARPGSFVPAFVSVSAMAVLEAWAYLFLLGQIVPAFRTSVGTVATTVE